jgi:hypothetical protein
LLSGLARYVATDPRGKSFSEIVPSADASSSAQLAVRPKRVTISECACGTAPGLHRVL